MLIWGSRGREILQGTGRFYCPQCDSDQGYKQYRVASYFTLYFIPLFETQHHGDFVKCQKCVGTFKTAVLDYKPPSQAERVLISIRSDLEQGTPIEMARTKLLNAGVAQDVTDQLVTIAAGDQHVRCGACNLTFVAGVQRCSGCGGKV